jgi:dipeptidyl aminopeptidase/acylaminoacyl peptidase
MWRGGAVGLLAGTALAGAAHSAPLPISAFFAPPASRGAQISPNGHYLALIERADQRDVVSVINLSTHAKTVALRARDGRRVSWVRWKGDERLLAAQGRKRHADGTAADGDDRAQSPRSGEVLTALDRDGTHAVTLSAGAQDARLAGLRISDTLNKDPAHVLVVAPDARGVQGVWKVDVGSGAAEFVGEGKDDPDDEVDGASMVVRYDHKPSKDDADFDILGPAPGGVGKRAYVALQPRSRAEGDTPSLRIYDFEHNSFSDPVWPTLKYEISDVVYRDGGDRVLAGVCYTADTYQCDFKDEGLNADYRAAQAHFGDDHNITPLSMSDDGRYWLMGVQGPTEPGAYYVFDRRTKKMTLAANRHPELPSAGLGRAERFVYKARDGMEIPAYLTLPPGDLSGPLPLVVLPHGGPEARDSLGFDVWAQVLATRGYLVLQPNFRGSSGYGRKYVEAGYGQWGGKMQNDITDGVMALIKSGRVDKDRVCIFGASFGGYAALYGAAQSPEIYKCAASFAGVADLNALVNWEHTTKGHEARYAYASKAIGDPVKDSARLRATSPIRFASRYKTPVLLIHGSEDRSVPKEQSQMMEQALRTAHKDVRLVIYPGEGHADWSPADEQSALTMVAGFIEGHIDPAKTGG